MKTIKLFTILALMLLTSVTANAQNSLVGDVNKDGSVNIADVTMVVDIILNGQKELSISASEIFLRQDNSATIVITSGYGSYTVSSNDRNIADATLNGSTVIITGKNGGTTVVKVIDTISGNMQDVSVTVIEDAPIAYPACPDENHPHLIDLGLPSGTKWACCNVGADTPEAYGGYYAWGATEENSSYVDTFSDISGTEYDVAHVKWGVYWCMPTSDNINELLDNCTTELTTFNGVNGIKFTNEINGSSIFLPAAGVRSKGEFNGAGEKGYYWSSTLGYGVLCKSFLFFDSHGQDLRLLHDPEDGEYEVSVRPILDVRELSLSASEISLDKGNSATIVITSGYGSYTVSSTDTNIAETTLVGSTVIITGKNGGTTVVKVIDTISGNMEEISVTVIDALICPDENHPHLIDLGLPSGTKWACCNVGADKPEAFGGYYAWGETEEKEVYNWNTYIYCDGSYETCHDIGSDISGTKYDVARVKWGGKWCMPTINDINELYDNTTSEWVTHNNVMGIKFTSKTNSSCYIFLPAVGGRWDGDLLYAGESGDYWSSTQEPDYSDYAYYLFFGSGYADWSIDSRSNGRSVRPVVRN